ncbi:MAG: hypothetical protein KF886_07045 [Candidatus Hydrogenedentes bacterium]|nr:hypothetical protein [Candidatus Hydrogenedentota bacterium]
MPTTSWKVADLAKIRKMRSSGPGKKANDKLKALKKSVGNAKKSMSELDQVMKDEPDA